MIKRSVGERIFEIVNIIILTLLGLIALYPLWHVLMASISSGDGLARHTGAMFVPAGFSLKAYRLVLETPMVLKGYGNTLYVLVFGLAMSMTMTILGAFALSRKGLYGRKVILLFIIFTMYFSGGMIPFYFTVKNVGLADTRWALIVPTCVNTFNFIIMRTGFEAIPVSLEESAKIDGANDFVVLWKIILPLAKPIIAVIVLYYAVGIWNSWFNAMLFLRNRELYPLQLVLREILIQNDTAAMTMGGGDADTGMLNEVLKYATICVATIPILVIYPFLQKYFAKGVMVGAVKG
ncbi:MAG: carbohydrate ABC transporter permease [Clostridia bacterium]|nr:carbohydrate ABC transporter permease [Clostridia bacterium]